MITFYIIPVKLWLLILFIYKFLERYLLCRSSKNVFSKTAKTLIKLSKHKKEYNYKRFCL